VKPKINITMKGRSNSSSRRLALTISTSSTMNDFINKKLGLTINKDKENENTTN